MIQHWGQCPLFSLIPCKKNCFLNKKLTLKINSASCIGSHGKYMTYVSFPWPPVVAAHDHKGLARAQYNSGSYCFRKNHPYANDSVMFISSYHSLQTVQKTISDQNRIFTTNNKAQGQTFKHCNISTITSFFHGHLYVTFFRSSSFDTLLLKLLQGIGSVRKWYIYSTKHCISRGALRFQIYN